MSEKPYRPNIGIALFNRSGLVFIGRALSSGPEIVLPGKEWQCPQGGIDAGEALEPAARRELFEETNIQAARLLAITKVPWAYDFPPYDGPLHKLSPFRGQIQHWAAFAFEGVDSDIDVVNLPTGEPQEFFDWRWERLAALPNLVTPHKRAVYEKMVAAFTMFSAPPRQD